MMSDLVESLALRLIQPTLEHAFGTADVAIPNGVMEAARTSARNILDFIEKAGHKIVPVEPTPEMMAAPEGAFPEGTSESIKQSWRDVYGEHYRLMLAAAPKVTP